MTCGLTKTGGISARSGRSCSGDRSTAATGCKSGSLEWQSTAASSPQTICGTMLHSSGSEVIEDSLETGEKLPSEIALRWLFVLVVLSWGVLWLLAALLGAMRR